MSSMWSKVRLGEVLEERRETPDTEALALGNIKIVSKISFERGQIELRRELGTKTGMILVRPGDLLLSGINAVKGAIAIYETENRAPIAATIHYGAYIVDMNRASPDYLWWYFRSNSFREILLQSLPEGIKTELKSKRLLPIEIPLPSLTEQRRILARIKLLAAQIVECRTLRKRAADTAEAMVAAQVSSYFATSLDWVTVRAVISNQKGSVRSGPFGSQLLHEEFVESGIAAIGTRDVQVDKFELRSGWFVTPDKFAKFKRYQVFPGDVLCTIVGASIGRFCVIPPDVPLAFTTKHVQALTLDRSKVEPRFVCLMLNFHERCRSSLFSQVEGSAQPSLNAEKVLSTELPLPPLAEQRKIVTQVDALAAKMDALKRLQAETSAELDALLPLILDRAFKGNL